MHVNKIISRFRVNWQDANRGHWIVFAVFYAVFANIPFWVACRTLDLLPLGWFCLEYAGVGLVALFVPRVLAATLLLLVIAADLIGAVSKTYYLSPTDCLTNIFSLHQLPATRLFAGAAVLVLLFLITAIAASASFATIIGKPRWRAAGCLIAFAAAAVSFDYAGMVHEAGHMSNPFRGARPTDVNRFSEFTNLWIARYPSIRLWRDQRLFGRHDTQSDGLAVLSATAMATRSMRLAAEKHTGEMPNLVLVIVESWGLETDSSIRNFLVGPYFQPNLRARYEILQGTVPFYRSTVSGEVRELCGNKLGTHVMYASKQDLQACLPNRLISLGYHNIAAHGMDGEMFNSD